MSNASDAERNVTFAVRADRQLIRAGARSRRFLCIEIQAPEAPSRPGRLPVNLAFVLDRSGSMDGGKIANAREAIVQGIRLLRGEDRFAVVAYDDQIDVVVSTTTATPKARDAALRAVARIGARNQTDLHGGWLRGCEQVAAHLAAEAVGRCFLLTDGLANAGVTDHDEIVRRCAAWRDRRVVTTTFGVGADFDETLLRRMADAGGGNFQFIESAVQIPDFVASEVGEALAITTREAVLVVEAGEGAVVESLNDFPCRRENSAWRIEIGSLFGGQSLSPVLRVTLPECEKGAECDVRVHLEDADGALGRPTAHVPFSAAGHHDNDRQPRDRAVDRLVATLYAARAERDALERNREHDFAGARRIIERCIRHILVYAGDDQEILAIVEDLREKVARYSGDMDGLTRKSLYSTSSRSVKGRAHDEKKRRRAMGRVVVLAAPGLGPLLRPVLDHLAAADAAAFGGLAFEETLGPWAHDPSGVLDRNDELRLLSEGERVAPQAAVRILFTTRRLGDNWFSHWFEDRHSAVVSLAGHESLEASAEAFVAYEVILHGLRTLGLPWAPEQLMHADTRGCLFDFCENREGMEIKLQAADLCPSCRDVLRANGVPIDRLARLCDVIRLLAAPAGAVH